MKYGDTLQQRSIPQWQVYNVDYNDIKRLIKLRTTQRPAQAIAIPGHDEEAAALQTFEDELYGELCEQHERVDLFIKSKSGELCRRLMSLEKHIEQLRRRYLTAKQNPMPVVGLKRFAKAEEAVLSSGAELQALSRFVGAQRLAFRKLLKKYRKWTGSPTLDHRFDRDILSQSLGLSNTSLQILLEHWADILAAVRAPFEAGMKWSAGEVRGSSCIHGKLGEEEYPGLERGSLADVFRALENDSPAMFDIAILTLPLSANESLASYWIHPDNLVQLSILLLQHTQIKRFNSSRQPSEHTSRRSSRQGSNAGEPGNLSGLPNDEHRTVYCADVQELVYEFKKQDCAKPDCSPGEIPSKSAMIVCGTDRVEACMAIRKRTGVATGQWEDKKGFHQISHRKKTILSLFEDLKDPEFTQAQDLDGWLAENTEVEPFGMVQSRKQRFVGLENRSQHHAFVTLEYDIRFGGCSAGSLEQILRDGSPEASFPFAVLTVRAEGRPSEDLIAALDQTHLAQRVPGFSLEKHTIATLYSDLGPSDPPWRSLLEQDIRKLPPPRPCHSRKPLNKRLSPTTPSLQRPSVSSPSAEERPNSTFSARGGKSSIPTTPEVQASPPLVTGDKKRLLPRRDPTRDQDVDPPFQGPNRYWNEFDDGDERGDKDGYFIYVERQSPAFPGSVVFGKCATLLFTVAHRCIEGITATSGNNVKKTPFEREPLIREVSSSETSDEDGSNLENADTRVRRGHVVVRNHRRYSTFPHSPPPDPHVGSRRRRIFSWTYGSLFAASMTLLLIAAALCAERPTRAHGLKRKGPNDFTILLCDFASLVIAFVGGSIMLCTTTLFGLTTKMVFIILTWLIILGNCVVAAIIW